MVFKKSFTLLVATAPTPFFAFVSIIFEQHKVTDKVTIVPITHTLDTSVSHSKLSSGNIATPVKVQSGACKIGYMVI